MNQLILTATDRQGLYKVDYDLKDSLEFEQVEWHKDLGFNNRLTAHTITDTGLKQLLNTVYEQQYTLLDELWKDDYFKNHLWAGTTWQQMQKHTRPFVELNKDLKGFRTGIHVDHRRAVAVGMLFLNKETLVEQSSVFYKDELGKDPISMPTGWAQGWYTANTHMSWHRGLNMSRDARYSIKFGVYLHMD